MEFDPEKVEWISSEAAGKIVGKSKSWCTLHKKLFVYTQLGGKIKGSKIRFSKQSVVEYVKKMVHIPTTGLEERFGVKR